LFYPEHRGNIKTGGGNNPHPVAAGRKYIYCCCDEAVKPPHQVSGLGAVKFQHDLG